MYFIDPIIVTLRQSLAIPSLENSLHVSFRQSRPKKVVGTVELYHVSPIYKCWKLSRFFKQKGKKNHLYIINIESRGRGEHVLTLLSGILVFLAPAVWNSSSNATYLS